MTDQDIDTAGTEADEEMDESLKNPEAKPLDPTEGRLGDEEQESRDRAPGQPSSAERPPAPPPPAG